MKIAGNYFYILGGLGMCFVIMFIDGETVKLQWNLSIYSQLTTVGRIAFIMFIALGIWLFVSQWIVKPLLARRKRK